MALSHFCTGTDPLLFQVCSQLSNIWNIPINKWLELRSWNLEKILPTNSTSWIHNSLVFVSLVWMFLQRKGRNWHRDRFLIRGWHCNVSVVCLEFTMLYIVTYKRFHLQWVFYLIFLLGRWFGTDSQKDKTNVTSRPSPQFLRKVLETPADFLYLSR